MERSSLIPDPQSVQPELTIKDLKYLKHLIEYSIQSVEKIIQTSLIEEQTAVENELATL